jgi:hypothetical protein
MIKNYTIIALILVPLLLIGCSEQSTNETVPQLEELYKNAVNDAIIIDNDEIATDLIAVNDGNSYIKRKVVDGKNYVLALVFTPYVSSYPIGDTVFNYWGETWVTIAPEMKDVFQSTKFENDSILQLKIQQLLGLPNSNIQRYFVEFWIDPDSLFRPTPDNEIIDSQADLHFPDNASADYKLWFNNNILNSYFPIATNATRYPWTRLGYTYNWRFGQKERGLSEFVLRKNSKIIVNFAGVPKEYLYN